MDFQIEVDKVDVSVSDGYYKRVSLDITGADEKFIQEISKEADIDDLLAGKTENEIKEWVISRYDWVQSLLNEFWQSSSDACPLEANEAEAQESAFETFVNSLK